MSLLKDLLKDKARGPAQHEEVNGQMPEAKPWSRRGWTREQLRSKWPHLTLQQVELMKEVFELFDTEGKGFFTKDELFFVMEAMGGSPTPQELDAVMYELDSNGDHVVDFPEFLTKFLTATDESELLQVFNQLAIQEGEGNDDRVVTYNAVARSFQYVGDPLSEQDKKYLQVIFEGADKDGNGRLDIKEFTAYLERMDDEIFLNRGMPGGPAGVGAGGSTIGGGDTSGHVDHPSKASLGTTHALQDDLEGSVSAGPSIKAALLSKLVKGGKARRNSGSSTQLGLVQASVPSAGPSVTQQQGASSGGAAPGNADMASAFAVAANLSPAPSGRRRASSTSGCGRQDSMVSDDTSIQGAAGGASGLVQAEQEAEAAGAPHGAIGARQPPAGQRSNGGGLLAAFLPGALGVMFGSSGGHGSRSRTSRISLDRLRPGRQASVIQEVPEEGLSHYDESNTVKDKPALQEASHHRRQQHHHTRGQLVVQQPHPVSDEGTAIASLAPTSISFGGSLATGSLQQPPASHALALAGGRESPDLAGSSVLGTSIFASEANFSPAPSASDVGSMPGAAGLPPRPGLPRNCSLPASIGSSLAAGAGLPGGAQGEAGTPPAPPPMARWASTGERRGGAGSVLAGPLSHTPSLAGSAQPAHTGTRHAPHLSHLYQPSLPSPLGPGPRHLPASGAGGSTGPPSPHLVLQMPEPAAPAAHGAAGGPSGLHRAPSGGSGSAALTSYSPDAGSSISPMPVRMSLAGTGGAGAAPPASGGQAPNSAGVGPSTGHRASVHRLGSGGRPTPPSTAGHSSAGGVEPAPALPLHEGSVGGASSAAARSSDGRSSRRGGSILGRLFHGVFGGGGRDAQHGAASSATADPHGHAPPAPPAAAHALDQPQQPHEYHRLPHGHARRQSKGGLQHGLHTSGGGAPLTAVAEHGVGLSEPAPPHASPPPPPAPPMEPDASAAPQPAEQQEHQHQPQTPRTQPASLQPGQAGSPSPLPQRPGYNPLYALPPPSSSSLSAMSEITPLIDQPDVPPAGSGRPSAGPARPLHLPPPPPHRPGLAGSLQQQPPQQQPGPPTITAGGAAQDEGLVRGRAQGRAYDPGGAAGGVLGPGAPAPSGAYLRTSAGLGAVQDSSSPKDAPLR